MEIKHSSVFHKKIKVSLPFAFCHLEFFNFSLHPPKFFKEKSIKITNYL